VALCRNLIVMIVTDCFSKFFGLERGDGSMLISHLLQKYQPKKWHSTADL